MPPRSRSRSRSSYSYSDSRSRSASPKRSSPRRERKGGRSNSRSYSSSSENDRNRKGGEGRRGKAEQPNLVLHVTNLTRNVNADHLKEIFGNYGSVENVELAIDKNVLLPKGYAYVEFASRAVAEAAIEHMHGGVIDSSRVSVSLMGGGGWRPGQGPRGPPPSLPPRAGGAHADPRRRSPPRRERSPLRRVRSPPPRRPPPRRRSPSPLRRSPPRASYRGSGPPRRADNPNGARNRKRSDEESQS
uniref:RRM domain-containing protein n=1 Tax=Calcidiscus leptoporus TaxID=127549 RepID=A0A7S0ISX5_9EUKA